MDDAICAVANTAYTFDITIPASVSDGEFVMRFRTNWIDFVTDACETYPYGNAADFKAQIGGGSGGDGWLTVSKDEGTLAAGESEVLDVIFNSNDVPDGTYLGGIMISSNDMANPMVTVPVTFIVINDVTPPDAPENLVYDIIGGHNVQLDWTHSSIATPFDPQWLTYSNEVVTNSIGTNAAVEFDVAARFTPDMLSTFENGAITKINFVPGEPETLSSYTLKIWQGAGNPTLIYQQPVTGITSDVWNEITLTDPVPFDNTQELWFGFGVNATGGYPAGCDDGPQVEGFSNMIYWTGAWTTLTALNADLTFNWAVQGYVEFAGKEYKLSPVIDTPPAATSTGKLASRTEKMNPPAVFVPATTRAITFNVNRNGTDVATGLSAPSYFDEDLNIDSYTYYVTAQEGTAVSDPSNSVIVIIVSVNEIGTSTFSIYPNPANGLVNIQSDINMKSAKLINLTGQVVYSQPISGNQVQISTKEFTAGVYTLQLETESGTVSHKLIIQ